jgi:hypothetical protein
MLNGIKREGEVCLSVARGDCVSNFGYIEAYQSLELPQSVDGILGLSQNKQMMKSSTKFEVGPLLVNALYT